MIAVPICFRLDKHACAGLFACPGEHGKKYDGEDGYYGYHNEKLDQRER